jgi:hypothetical protein
MKQRGFGLIELAIYGVIFGVVAAGIWKAWSGFKESIAAPYIQEQVAKDQKTLDAFKHDAVVADERAQHAEKDRDDAIAAASKQTDALKAAQVAQEQAQTAARALSVKYAQAMAANAARVTRLQSQAGATPVQGRSCTEVLGATDAILRESQKLVESMQ